MLAPVGRWPTTAPVALTAMVAYYQQKCRRVIAINSARAAPSHYLHGMHDSITPTQVLGHTDEWTTIQMNDSVRGRLAGSGYKHPAQGVPLKLLLYILLPKNATLTS